MSYYKITCHLLLLLLILPLSLQATTLHAILFADTLDKKIGADKDQVRMSRQLKEIEKYTNLSLKLQVINDTSVSPGSNGYQEVTRAINQLSVNSDDVVIFYYSGHGVNRNERNNTDFSDEARWPLLALLSVAKEESSEQPSLDSYWVKKTLWGKNPRLLMVIADACNNYQGRRKGFATVPDGKATAFRKLFLEYQGYLLASGSRPGEFSFGSEEGGGHFTNAFLTSLSQELAVTDPTWERIIERARQPIETGIILQKLQRPLIEDTLEMTRKTADSSSPPLSESQSSEWCLDGGFYFKNGLKYCRCQDGREIPLSQ